MAAKKTPKQVPNPGSNEALEQGCTCPVLDNNHGWGFPRGDGSGPAFWIAANCPLHGSQGAA